MSATGMRIITVLDSGLLTTVQDLGRHGAGALGVSPSGAADWFAARAANRLVGNADDAPLLETTLTGASFASGGDCIVAVTGAEAALTIGGRDRRRWRTWAVGAGDRIVVGPPVRGVRSYVAFGGGVNVPPIMSSASTDVGGGFGGRVLATGDALALNDEDPSRTVGTLLAYPAEAIPSLDTPAVLRAMVGPDSWRLGADCIEAIFSAEFRVAPRSNRQAVRLDGAPLATRSATNRISAGVSAGCVQVTGDGLPVVMLAEHQTTGGYPVAICVVWADVPRAAQLRPGDAVRFERVDFGGARAALNGSATRLCALTDALQAVEERLARGFFEGA